MPRALLTLGESVSNSFVRNSLRLEGIGSMAKYFALPLLLITLFLVGCALLGSGLAIWIRRIRRGFGRLGGAGPVASQGAPAHGPLALVLFAGLSRVVSSLIEADGFSWWLTGCRRQDKAGYAV